MTQTTSSARPITHWNALCCLVPLSCRSPYAPQGRLLARIARASELRLRLEHWLLAATSATTTAAAAGPMQARGRGGWPGAPDPVLRSFAARVAALLHAHTRALQALGQEAAARAAAAEAAATAAAAQRSGAASSKGALKAGTGQGHGDPAFLRDSASSLDQGWSKRGTFEAGSNEKKAQGAGEQGPGSSIRGGGAALEPGPNSGSSSGSGQQAPLPLPLTLLELEVRVQGLAAVLTLLATVCRCLPASGPTPAQQLPQQQQLQGSAAGAGAGVGAGGGPGGAWGPLGLGPSEWQVAPLPPRGADLLTHLYTGAP